MKANHRLVALAIFIVSVLVAAIIINSRPTAESGDPGEQLAQKMSAIEARVGDHQASLVTTGRVSSQTDIQLIAQASGRIESVQPGYREGATFKAGDLLVTIEKADYQNSLIQARSNLASAEQQLATEKGQALQAQREWRDLGNTEANALFLREPQLEAAEQQVEAALANLAQAELNLERTDIVAPFDGVIRSRSATLGQFVASGSPIAEITASNSLQVRVSLSQSQVDSLGWSDASAAGGKSQVRINQNGQVREIDALIRHLSPLVDPMTQMVELILDIPNAGLTGLQAGQFVEVQLSGQNIEQTAWVPDTALYERASVLVANDGAIVIQPISIHAINANQLLVSGISEGDLVIVDRPLWVFEGQAVAAEVLNGDFLARED